MPNEGRREKDTHKEHEAREDECGGAITGPNKTKGKQTKHSANASWGSRGQEIGSRRRARLRYSAKPDTLPFCSAV